MRPYLLLCRPDIRNLYNVATREVAEEIMTALEPLGNDEVSIVACTLIALTLKHKGDHEWLRKSMFLKVGLASTAEEVTDYLLSWPESA